MAISLISWQALVPDPLDAAKLFWDKANHCIAFAVLAFLLDFSFRGSAFPGWKGVLLLSYGFLLELLQGLSSYREYSNWDLLADAIGLMAYWLVAAHIHRLFDCYGAPQIERLVERIRRTIR